MTMSCRRLVGTAVAVVQAGQLKWVRKENLSRSLISFTFSFWWWQGPALPSAMVQCTWQGVQHPQPPAARPHRDWPLLCDCSPGHVVSFMPWGMDSPPGLWPDAAAWQENASSPLLFPRPGRSRQVQWELRIPGHPSAVDEDGSCWTNTRHKPAAAQVLPSPGVGLQTGQGCSHFGCKTWASATPFGSWIFMAGLPSDEKQIIHPHSNLDLGLSQVLGNIFPDTAAFSLHEGFDGSAGNSFKPGHLCPVMPFSQWDALSSSGGWSRQGMGQREAAVLWVTTWHS